MGFREDPPELEENRLPVDHSGMLKNESNFDRVGPIANFLLNGTPTRSPESSETSTSNFPIGFLHRHIRLAMLLVILAWTAPFLHELSDVYLRGQAAEWHGPVASLIILCLAMYIVARA